MQTAEERRCASQSRNKSDFEKKVKVQNQDIQVGDRVFVRRETPKEVKGRGKTGRSFLSGHHKLRSKALGPYEVLDKSSHTVTILRDGLADKISKDRVVRRPIPVGSRQGRPDKTRRTDSIAHRRG